MKNFYLGQDLVLTLRGNLQQLEEFSKDFNAMRTS